MKIKCANCNQPTITIKQTLLSPKKMTCSQCNAELSREIHKFSYYFYFLLSYTLSLLVAKKMMSMKIPLEAAVPLFPLLVFLSLHLASSTKLYTGKSEIKGLVKEFILVMVVLVPLIVFITLLLSKTFG